MDGKRASRTVCSSARARRASVFLVVVVILGKGGKRRVRDVSEGVLVAKDRNAVSTRGAGTREVDLAIRREKRVLGARTETSPARPTPYRYISSVVSSSSSSS